MISEFVLKSRSTILIFNLLSFLFLQACSGQPWGEPSNVGGGSLYLRGAGASFPKPIYEKWMAEYGKLNPDSRIDYQSTGSGAGINAILGETVDFGASDTPMKDDDLKKAPGEIIHVPTVLGAVVLTYNLENFGDKRLHLAPDVVADIYLGKITRWNDARIKADNREANLPDKNIRPVYRADSSGTTFVFTDYLSKVSAEWKERVGRNTQPSWIKGVGVSAPRNDGVMGEVKQTPNTIGYVELIFAKSQNLPTALIKNSAGNFVEAGAESVGAAAIEALPRTPDDLRVEITNTDGAQVYPIASYTYMLVYKKQKSTLRGKMLADFLWWATHDGQHFAKELSYEPLPPEIVAKVETRLKEITSDGKPLISHQ